MGVIIDKVVSAALAIGLSILLLWILSFLIDRVFIKKLPKKKQNTLRPLLKSTVNLLFIFNVILIVLDAAGVPTTSVLAVAGIGSLALGFGSQSLVKDFLSGFFIIAENQYNVGDVIRIDGNEGRVENITFRTTFVRNIVNAEVYIIPNGDIKVVTNLSSQYRHAVVEINVPYDVQLKKVMDVLTRATSVFDITDGVLSSPVVDGVTDFTPSGISVRVRCEVNPDQSWAVERKLRQYLKESLENEGIHLPFVDQVVRYSVGGEGESNGK